MGASVKASHRVDASALIEAGQGFAQRRKGTKKHVPFRNRRLPPQA
jgi:ribosomal protein S6E (S10)